MGKIRCALISLADKTGIEEFARVLQKSGVQILSTGGTARLLKEKGIPVTEVSEYTGQPEILDGRLKTLHPKIHGGILAVRSNEKHLRELEESGIQPIDLVVVNLYPFEETVNKPNVSLETAVENIDIGGPTMLRAAAKNWRDVTVVTDPADYSEVIRELKKKNGEISPETNFRLAQKVFARTARYDGAIANYLTGGREGKFPEVFNLQATKVQDLRYGENPHQKAAFYRFAHPSPVPPAGGPPSPAGGEGNTVDVVQGRQLHGKELSFNNILDLDAAMGLVREFREPACVIVKHTNPCGVAALTRSAAGGPPSPAEGRGLFVAARQSDPLSAFGGIIGFNREVDAATAAEIGKDFYECVAAPAFESKALDLLTGKKNIRLMEVRATKGEGGYDLKKVAGGLLVQDRDLLAEPVRVSKVVTKREPTEDEWQALEFAWRVVKHVKSNAIVLAGSEGGLLRTFGVGAGQMSRIDSVRIAIEKMVASGWRDRRGPPAERAGPRAGRALPGGTPPTIGGDVRHCFCGGQRGRITGATGPASIVLASDAFFPFRDSVDEAAKAGVTAIVQPGGSLKDRDSIQAADEQGIAMVFTGVRHFRH